MMPTKRNLSGELRRLTREVEELRTLLQDTSVRATRGDRNAAQLPDDRRTERSAAAGLAALRLSSTPSG